MAYNDSAAHTRMWWPVLTALSTLAADRRLDVRLAALEALFDALETHGTKFSSGLWGLIFKGVLIPLLDELRHLEVVVEGSTRCQSYRCRQRATRRLGWPRTLLARRRRRCASSGYWSASDSSTTSLASCRRFSSCWVSAWMQGMRRSSSRPHPLARLRSCWSRTATSSRKTSGASSRTSYATL